MLLNFVSLPRFKPATIGLSDKIHTHLTTAPSTWFRGSFHGLYTNGDDRLKGYQIRARSCYTSWSLFCSRFVDIQQSFSCICRMKDGNYFSQLRWTKPKVMLPFATNYSLFYSLRRRKSISVGTTIPLYVIICRWQIAHPHQNCTKCGVFKIIFQDFVEPKCSYDCLSPLGRFLSVRANNIRKSIHEIKIFCAATLELVYKLLAGPPKKCKCFSEISR